MYSIAGKAKISSSVFNVTWSFRNHSNMVFCCSRNISSYYQCWKLEVLLNFLQTVILFLTL